MQNLEEALDSINKFDFTGYKKLFDLDNGNCGTVYLAQKEDRVIAIKEFFSRKNEDEDEKANMIIREIKNLSKCSSFHQLIIPFRGISFKDLNGDKCDFPLVILDFATNGSLQNYFQKSKKEVNEIPSYQKMIFLYGIAKAMECLHFLQITHRDLKPANILLNDKNYPLLADLGVSKLFDIHSTDPSTLIGTLTYEAPEVLNGTVTNNECFSTDVFSYSLISYFIISGKEPYEELKEELKKNLSFRDQIDFLSDKRFKLPDEIFPSYFQLLISLLWQNNPNDRPSFSDVVSLFDAGVMLPIENENELKQYLEYRDFLEAPSLLNEERLIQKRNELKSQNKLNLANVITFYLADQLNNAEAQIQIGIRYSYGEELILDRDKGFKYFSKAAEQDHSEALFYVGKAYKYGIGCQINDTKSKESFQKAADLGNELAKAEIINNSYPFQNIPSKSNLAVLFGSFSTGKTTFVNKIRDFYNNSQTISTLRPDEYELMAQDDDNEWFCIKIRDTMSMEQFKGLNKNYFRNAQLAILIFDLSDINSFNKIDNWITLLREANGEAKLIIIGNKIDKIANERKILKVDALEKADMNDAKYFEISALNGDYIEYPKQEIIDFFKRRIKLLKKINKSLDETPTTPTKNQGNDPQSKTKVKNEKSSNQVKNSKPVIQGSELKEKSEENPKNGGCC